jgi:hypothetical protein
MDQERKVCSSCYAENELDAQICSKCGLPIHSAESLDPVQRDIVNRGYYIGEGIKGRVRPIVFWGMWLLCGPYLVVSTIALFNYYTHDQFRYERLTIGGGVLGVIESIIFSLISLALLYIVTVNYIKTKRKNINNE